MTPLQNVAAFWLAIIAGALAAAGVVEVITRMS